MRCPGRAWLFPAWTLALTVAVHAAPPARAGPAPEPGPGHGALGRDGGAALLPPVSADSVAAPLGVALEAADDGLLEGLIRGAGPRVGPPAPGVPVHDVRGSAVELAALLRDGGGDERIVEALDRRFVLRPVAGRDGAGTVLFTGYFAPEYAAGRHRDERYRFPVHGPPQGIACGNPRRIIWHSRAEIERDDLLRGREIAWLADPLDLYLVHVNGSARLRLPDGATMQLTHCGTNERPYTSLGALLVEAGLIDSDDLSMQAIRDLNGRRPEVVAALMRRNDRYVFFREDRDPGWPRSSDGAPLIPFVSLAADPAIVPPGAPVLVVTRCDDGSGPPRELARLMIAHDTGGAIVGPGRADIFMGVGPAAGRVAGRQRFDGRMYVVEGKGQRD